MTLIKLVYFSFAIIASCQASGFGHLVPAPRSLSVVRYAPFYNFPNGVRSIHAVAPAPVPVLPAPLPVVAPAPIYPVGPLPAGPPAFHAPWVPAAAIPGPVLPAPPVISAPAPIFGPAFPRFAAPAYPAPVFTRDIAAPVPFAPVVRAVAPAAPAPYFTPALAPAPVGVHSHLHLYNRVFAPLPAPYLKQAAWK